MYLITEEGKIYEGTALTSEEAEIYDELICELGNRSGSSYISTADRHKLTGYLLSTFVLVRRKPLVQEPEISLKELDPVAEEPKQATLIPEDEYDPDPTSHV